MMRHAALRATPYLSAYAPRSGALAAQALAAAAVTSTHRGYFAATTMRAAPKTEAFSDPDMTHFRRTATSHPLYKKDMPPHVASALNEIDPASAEYKKEWSNPTQNAVWSKEELAAVKKTHLPTRDVVDTIALYAIKFLRKAFDVVSGYVIGRVTPNKILRRALFLETAAGIPGMVAGTLRHLESLRRMKRDHGWIHTLLEEAENERMHMLVFMKRYQPGLFFRGLVVITQGVFWNVFFIAYLVSPRLCHRFVGYLEEEAVRTYTHILEVMQSTDPRDADVVAFAQSPADEIAIRYWKLPADAKMIDVILAVRADEANHRDVNHTFASMKHDDRNPFLEHKHGSAGEFIKTGANYGGQT